MGISNGSEGTDTVDSALPDTSSGVQPAPATLADVWGRMQECSAFGLEVPCSAKGSVSCSYFVPHLSALHIVATLPPDEQPGLPAGLDGLFDEGESALPPEVLRGGGRMHEYAVDEAATDGTAEDSGTDPHVSGGDGDTMPSPGGGGGMFMDSSGFLHSGAPSTSRGSVMHVCLPPLQVPMTICFVYLRCNCKLAPRNSSRNARPEDGTTMAVALLLFAFTPRVCPLLCCCCRKVFSC